MQNDQPGYSPNVPGLGAFNPHDDAMAPHGSDSLGENAGMYQDGGPALATVPVSHIYDSNAGNVPMVTVHANATYSAENPLLDKVSGVVTPTDWTGHVAGPHHPNAGH